LQADAVPSAGPVVAAREAVKVFRKGPRIGPLSFSVSRGELFALIGPNGSGKTTTIRMVLGIYRPDRGVVRLCGMEPRRARGCAAYVPEETAVYPRLTGWEHLLFFARLYAATPREAERLAQQAAEYSQLGPSLNRRVSGYSKGMRRRLLLGFALALETPLLVLDEPTSGLDVISSVKVRMLIREAADAGRAVLMSSHNMLEVERLADTVAFLADGKIVDQGRPSDLVARYGARDLEEAFVRAVGGAP